MSTETFGKIAAEIAQIERDRDAMQYLCALMLERLGGKAEFNLDSIDIDKQKEIITMKFKIEQRGCETWFVVSIDNSKVTHEQN